MNRVIPEIYSGNHNLVLTDSILCDDTEPLVISIPTTSGKPDSLIFEFASGEVNNTPEHNIENGRIKVKLGSMPGAFLGTKFKVSTNIAGKQYFYLFCLTRIVGKTLRVEISLYEQKGLLK